MGTRRFCTACVVSLMAILPALDVVYCPDGCGNANRPECAWHADTASTSESCGLCLNGIAVRCSVVRVDPVRRLIPIPVDPASDLVSIPPRSLDRPPRCA